MKSKKVLMISLMFILGILIMAIPTKVQAGDGPLPFTTNFLNAMKYTYSYYDTDNDGQFSQEEIDVLDTLWLGDQTEYFSKADFECLNYFTNVRQIILEYADFAGTVDLSGLYYLKSFRVEHVDCVDENNLPFHFTVNSRIWLYIAAPHKTDYNFETDQYVDYYDYNDKTNYRILSLYVGGLNEICVGDDIQLFDKECNLYSYNLMAPGFNQIYSDNSDVADVYCPNDWSTYTLCGYSVGETILHFHSGICIRDYTYTITEPDANYTATPKKEANNRELKLFKNGRVLDNCGILYEADTSNYNNPMRVVTSGITGYAYKDYGAGTGCEFVLQGNTLTINYQKDLNTHGMDMNGNEIWIPVDSQIVWSDVAFVNNDGLVLKTNGDLYYFDKYYYDSEEHDVEYTLVASNVTQVLNNFYLSNGKIGTYSFYEGNGLLTSISATSIEDAYDWFLLKDGILYYVYRDYDDTIKVAVVYSNVAGFVKSPSGEYRGIQLKNGTILSHIDWTYSYNGMNYSSEYNFTEYMYAPALSEHSADPYYRLLNNGKVYYGTMSLTQVTDVVTIVPIYVPLDDTMVQDGVLILRNDNTIWYQHAPFTPWKKMLSIANFERMYPDVPNDKWYAPSVEYVKKYGIMTGYGNGNFGGEDNLSRGMIVTMLYRLAGSPDVSALSNPFKDVPKGAWYENPVKWAVANGITTGYTSTSFGPNDNVTREQIATFITRYAANILGRDTSSTVDLQAEFADGANVGVFAVDGLKYCVQNGVITGDMKLGYPRLLAKNTATRGEAATMFMRFCQNIMGKL